jgi:hypothetical protein
MSQQLEKELNLVYFDGLSRNDEELFSEDSFGLPELPFRHKAFAGVQFSGMLLVFMKLKKIKLLEFKAKSYRNFMQPKVPGIHPTDVDLYIHSAIRLHGVVLN